MGGTDAVKFVRAEDVDLADAGRNANAFLPMPIRSY
jgi:hypothetical protein